MAGSINIKCPKCGKQIVEPLSALNADSKLTCGACGTVMDFKEVQRVIKEQAKLAAFKITTKATLNL